MAAEITITGVDDASRLLRTIPAELRAQPLRNALAAGLRHVRDQAKSNAPVLATAAKYRKAGTLRDNIRVRTSKRDKKAGNVGVFLNVKPRKGAVLGAKSQDDSYYWRWQEFGWHPGKKANRTSRGKSRHKRARIAGRLTGKIPGKRFLTQSASNLPRALEIFKVQIAKWFVKKDKAPK